MTQHDPRSMSESEPSPIAATGGQQQSDSNTHVKLQPSDSWGDQSVFAKELPAGSLLGYYKILKVLGSGGFGITYLVRDTMLKRDVVLKENFPAAYAYRDPFTGRVLPNNAHDTESFQWTQTNFLNEARTLAQLSHPGIVRILSIFEGNGTAYFAMDYIHGLPLDYLREQQQSADTRYTESKLKGLLIQILQTLAYLHGKNICHRDIKPANILLTQEGTPVLVDFGSSRHIEHALTQTVLTTHGYSAPEQALGQNNTGPWSDLYSLGATFYYILTGKAPDRAEGRLIDDKLAPLSNNPELDKEYSQNFLQSIDRALAPKVDDRYHTAEEWLEDLDADIHPLPALKFSKEEFKKARSYLPAFTTVLSKRKTRKNSSKRTPLMAWCAGIFALLCVISAAVWYFYPEPPPPQKQDPFITPNLGSWGEWSLNPQIVAEPRETTEMCSMASFPVNLAAPNLSKLSFPPFNNNDISLISVHLTLSQPNKTAPPVYLTIRDDKGALIAKSLNEFAYSCFDGPLLTVFRFTKLPLLNALGKYQFSFETQAGEQYPVQVAASHIQLRQGTERLQPHFKLICTPYDAELKNALRKTENTKVQNMLVSSWEKNRTQIDAIKLNDREQAFVRRLAQAGYPGAQYKVARLLFEKHGHLNHESVAWLYRAAIGGSIIAQRDLAFLLVGGTKYFPDFPVDLTKRNQSYARALDFLRMSFSTGEPTVLYMLGLLYSQGWGIGYSANTLDSLAQLLKDSDYDLTKIAADGNLIGHWELLDFKPGEHTRMRCTVPHDALINTPVLQLVRTSKATGDIPVSRITVLRDNEEHATYRCNTALTQTNPTLQIPLNLQKEAQLMDDVIWSVEITMAPGNTSGIVQMVKASELADN